MKKIIRIFKDDYDLVDLIIGIIVINIIAILSAVYICNIVNGG